MGLSGSGKSTLVALLLRLYDPTEGALLLDGRDLRGLDAAWFRGQVGVVSQARGRTARCGGGGGKGACRAQRAQWMGCLAARPGRRRPAGAAAGAGGLRL